MNNKPVTCIYCATINPAGSNRCKACGAPIDIPITPPIRVTVVNEPSTPVVAPPPVTDSMDNISNTISEVLQTNEPLKEGLKNVGVGLGTLGIWSVLYRTAAEAIAIAFSAFVIGYRSGAAGSFLLAVAGGMLVGLAVGLVVKRSWLVMISAPLGTILGLGAAYFMQSWLTGIFWSPLLAAAGGVVFALLGGHRHTNDGIAKWYERIRPVLGMGGGFIFAILGYLLGSLIH